MMFGAKNQFHRAFYGQDHCYHVPGYNDVLYRAKEDFDHIKALIDKHNQCGVANEL